MSAKAKRIERSQRFRRLRRGENRSRAVSPVVATLILILIAVAAAAALYLWLVVWQGNITGGIGQPSAHYTLTIGGSTSVYPFSSLAASWFEANNSDTIISDNQGGTGAGMLAVCAGNVDIGAASSLETASGLVASDGCPASDLNTIQINTVAYDAVDVIVPVGNDHGLVSISYDTLTAIYDGASTTPATLLPSTYNTVALTSVEFATVAPFDDHGALSWSQVPAAVVGATVTGCTAGSGVEAASAIAATGTTTQTGAACGTNDYYTASGTASSCGFTICAGGTVAFPGTDAVVPVERSDASGTTQTFEARVLGATSSSAFATSFSGLGFSGCGSNNLLSDCGISVAHAENGNPAVITYVAGNPDAIGYASDGLTRASTSGVTCQNVATAACGIGLAYPGESVGVAPQPSLGASGSIAGGVVNGGFGTPGLTTTVSVANSYAGARPFEFVSLQPYTGVGQEFLTFITDPANNIALASETGEVSIYSI
jgi:flagellin-like protein